MIQACYTLCKKHRRPGTIYTGPQQTPTKTIPKKHSKGGKKNGTLIIKTKTKKQKKSAHIPANIHDRLDEVVPQVGDPLRELRHVLGEDLVDLTNLL